MNMAFLEGDTAKKTLRQKLPIHGNPLFFSSLLLPNFSFLPSLESKNKKDLLDQDEVVETALTWILFSATAYALIFCLTSPIK